MHLNLYFQVFPFSKHSFLVAKRLTPFFGIPHLELLVEPALTKADLILRNPK